MFFLAVSAIECSNANRCAPSFDLKKPETLSLILKTLIALSEVLLPGGIHSLSRNRKRKSLYLINRFCRVSFFVSMVENTSFSRECPLVIIGQFFVLWKQSVSNIFIGSWENNARQKKRLSQKGCVIVGVAKLRPAIS